MLVKHSKNSGKQVGVISQDMIHKLDTLTEESEAQNSPYVAKRKNTVTNNQMFGEQLYSDSEEEEEGTHSYSGIAVVIGVIAVITVIAIGAIFII